MPDVDTSEWFFDTARDYFEQLTFYKRHKHGSVGAFRSPSNGLDHSADIYMRRLVAFLLVEGGWSEDDPGRGWVEDSG